MQKALPRSFSKIHSTFRFTLYTLEFLLNILTFEEPRKGAQCEGPTSILIRPLCTLAPACFVLHVKKTVDRYVAPLLNSGQVATLLLIRHNFLFPVIGRNLTSFRKSLNLFFLLNRKKNNKKVFYKIHKKNSI